MKTRINSLAAVFTTALLLPFVAGSCKSSDEPSGGGKVNAICTTGDADEITINSVTLKGIAVIEGTPLDAPTACFYVSAEGTTVESIVSTGKKIPATPLTNEGGAFSAVATDLNPATEYWYVAAVSVNGKESYGSIYSFRTLLRPAEIIVTAESQNITKNTAVLYGYVDLEQAGVSDVQFGIIISTNENPSENNGRMWRSYEVDRNNKYFVEVSGLTSGTTYYYKAFVKVGDLLRVGEVKQFTTTSYNAAVTTGDVDEISPVQATLNGSLKIEESSEVSRSVWFLLSPEASTLSELKDAGTRINANFGQDGYFSAIARGLVSSLKYYYVACASVADGTFYGEVKSFTTEAISASVSTGSASDINIASATIGGTLKNDSGLEANVGFLYSSSASSLEQLIASGKWISASLKSDGASFTSSLTSLDSGTKYYYMAVASVGEKEFYGDVKSFTTTAINATVSTLDASDIVLFTAMLNGSIKVDNTETLEKEVWFLYSSGASSLDELKNSGTRVSTASISYDGLFVYVLTDLPSDTKFYYVACAKVAGKEFYGSVKKFSTKKESDYGEAVDLGLSVKWRSCNIGATCPEEYGNYFAWGETEPKSNYSWSTYKWCNGSSTSLTKYNNSVSYGAIDNRTVLEKDDDVAFVKLGGKWRMPTDEEWTELRENCTWTTITTGYHSYVYKVTSKKNGNSIFLPDAGYRDAYLYDAGSHGNYWSSSISTGYPESACYVYFISRVDEKSDVGGGSRYRYLGLSVRPVTK